jgi:hypothetical protein
VKGVWSPQKEKTTFFQDQYANDIALTIVGKENISSQQLKCCTSFLGFLAYNQLG